MSDFIDNEAEVSSDEEEIVNRRRKIASDDDDTGNEDDVPVRKRRNVDDDDEEEEEDDEEKLREEMKDLINDDEEEEEEEEEDAEMDSDDNVGHKRRKRHDDYYDALEDEDYDLIEENLGVKVQRKKKFKRLRRIEDDEESDAEESRDSVGRQPVDDREAIANELFEGSDGEVEGSHAAPAAEDDEQFKDISGSEVESDPDDFIVGDDGQPITKGKRKRHLKYTDAALQEAQDIFGVDFDYNEFEQYGEEYEEDLDEEEYEEEEEEGEGRPRPKKSVHKRPTKKSIFDVFEPSELERGHFTDLDNEIRSTDIPERFQLRSVPVTQADDDEVDEEAEWIYRQAFYTPTISVQNPGCQREEAHYPIAGRKPYSAVPKIREALKFMRNQSFEVPFIAFYRKEYVEPELNINDLWTVYRWDEKWCQLIAKKRNLKRLFEKMQQFQCDEVMKDPDKPLAEGLRPLENGDIFRLREAQTQEEVRDISSHFKLYYAQDLEAMRENAHKKRIKELKETQNEENGKEDIENETELDGGMNRVKHPIRKNAYTVCKDSGLDGLAKKFGLTPEHFGENLRDNYQRHEVDQYPIGPLELAGDYVSKRFLTSEEALKAARYMVATQISYDPVVRRCVRQTYFERAKINVKPSKQGIKEIDENHPCYTMKYLRNKPLKDLVSDQFLRLVIAEGEGLLSIEISMHQDDGGPHIYLDEIKQLYYRDEFSKNVQEWNEERYKALEIALVRFLYPLFQKEMRLRLLTESKEGIVKQCCRKLYNWLKVAPYQIEQSVEEEEDYDTREGIRVMAIAFFPNREIPAFAALIDGTGEVTDYLRLAHILKRRNSWKDKERADKENDLQALRRFITTKKPHVITVGGESREALMLVSDIKAVVAELMESEQMPAINVELIDNELANVYMSSKKGEADFRDYPPLLRQAISLARRLQDPLIEFSQLCTPDEEIACLKYHPLQNHIEKEELLGALYLEFVNRTNEVGVDINQAIAHPHTSNLVQFVCGLGPRKGGALLKTLKQGHQRLESRTQLVTVCHMGPKVFINCAGFIKIDTSSLGDSTETYVEVLDGSRVHPEAYEWARKMAVDALEYDDMSEDVNPAGALEEILENPEKLKDLDLDAFAEELERQGYGNKSITLYDIRAELNHRYKDLRTPYRPPTAEESFNMLTKETPHTFYIGKLVLVQVIDIARKKPKGEQLDQANPIRNDETGLWQCPFCLKNNFPELSEVWNHFDAGNCPGQAMGVRVRLDNGVSGFVPTKLLSDKHVTNPEERVKKGMTVHGRITKIDIERFAVDVTCKSSDLKDQNNEWRPPKDLYYDYDAEDKDRQIDEEQMKKQNRQTYIKRVIVHPSFHNISFKEAEKLLATMDQGEVIIRPSSKGADHLTVTWKVHEGINQHIDVREEGKENAFSLGQSLWINNDEFEDLDEIIARYVQPMALHARDLINFKYFHDANGGERETMEKLLNEEKKKAPSRIHYFVSCCKDFPGTFLLSYLPRKKVRHEFIKVTPEGFRYRQQIFHSINSLFRWFKEHFRDSIIGTPGTIPSRTPLGQSSYATTPNINFANVDAQAIQRAAANIPSHVFNTLSQVAGQTPGFQGSTNNFGASYSGSNYNFQPYTPSQPIATPLVTPSYHSVSTPAPSVATPRFPPQTPQSNWTHSVQTPQPQTPSHRGSVTPSVGNASVGGAPTTPKPTLPSNPSAADWKRMAEQWAKKVREQDTRITRTPRTPMRGLISPSPMIESTPAADSTPLIDEH